MGLFKQTNKQASQPAKILDPSLASYSEEFTMSSSSANARHVPAMVYRGDTRGPSEVFKNGFKPHGGDEDLLKHVHGGENLLKSGYISTSQSLRTPAAFLTAKREDSYVDPAQPLIKYDKREGWVYYIDTSNLHMSYVPDLLVLTQKDKDKYGYQQEWAIKGPIPPQNIKQAQRVDGYIKRYSDFTNMKQGVDPIFPPNKADPYKETTVNSNYKKK